MTSCNTGPHAPRQDESLGKVTIAGAAGGDDERRDLLLQVMAGGQAPLPVKSKKEPFWMGINFSDPGARKPEQPPIVLRSVPRDHHQL